MDSKAPKWLTKNRAPLVGRPGGFFVCMRGMVDRYSSRTVARSTNQLLGCTKPLILEVMARGPTS